MRALLLVIALAVYGQAQYIESFSVSPGVDSVGSVVYGGTDLVGYCLLDTRQGDAVEIVFRPRSVNYSRLSGSLLGLIGEGSGSAKVSLITDRKWTTTFAEVSINRWNHLLIGYDTPVFYVNGDSVHITEDGPGQNRADIIIDPEERYIYDGDIALVKYWDKVPTRSEVKTLYIKEIK